jgi:hypothetical protein
MLSRLPDVSGVIDDSGGNWLYLGGYYYLHQAAPDGYVFLARSGRMTIWRRIKDPAETPTAPGYSTHTPVPFDGKTISPRVTPRW